MDARAALRRELEAGIADERVLAALAAVPRGPFVPAAERHREWENRPLPIGAGQTISQPLVVGKMLEALDVRPGHRVLDVGTGSGWHAALLAELGGEVWSVERHEGLAGRAGAALAGTGVTVVHGDGTAGLPAHAPFDRVNVAAAARRLPPALVEQLAPGGRLVAPVGGRRQELVLVSRERGAAVARRLGPVSFVPLVPARRRG